MFSLIMLKNCISMMVQVLDCASLTAFSSKRNILYRGRDVPGKQDNKKAASLKAVTLDTNI